MTANRLTTLLAGRPAIFDGGYGWLLQDRGLPAGDAAELWNLENASAIEELHEVADMYRNGQIVPQVTRYTMDQALEAYQALVDGKISGRAVVVPHS